jgi:methylmalonyl-CoA/ethylmalonyl-CoA epimerase
MEWKRPNIALADDLLGDMVQVCLVSRDCQRTMDGLLRLGIGPWRLHSHNPNTLSETRYRGAEHNFSCKMCYAHAGNMMWEVVQPTGGTGIFDEFLERYGEGVHHFGFNIRGRSFSEAIAEFARRGFTVAQSGRAFNGQVGYAFIDGFEQFGVYFEIWDHPPGGIHPEPDSWYPAPPAMPQR